MENSLLFQDFEFCVGTSTVYLAMLQTCYKDNPREHPQFHVEALLVLVH